MIRVALEALAGSGRVKEVEEDLGGSWTVPECMEGPQVRRRFLGRVFNNFGGLLWSGRVWKGPRGPTRIWKGPGGFWCAWRIWEGL